MTDMQRMKEEIAKELCKLDGWDWEGLLEVHRKFYDLRTKSDYLRDADQILNLLKAQGTYHTHYPPSLDPMPWGRPGHDKKGWLIWLEETEDATK